MKIKSYTVYSADGKQLLCGKAHDAGVATLPLQGLGSGMFVLTVKDSGNQIHSYKILKK